MKTIKLKNAISDIFGAIDYEFAPSDDALNDAYLSHSGEKIVSPLVMRSVSSATLTEFSDVFGDTCYEWVVTIPEAKLAQLGAIITVMFSDKWEKLEDAMALEYNPIENYDSEEHEVVTETNTGTVTDSGSVTATDTGTVTDSGSVNASDTGTVTDSGTDTGTDIVVKTLQHGLSTRTSSQGTASTANNVFGFNTADDGVPSDISNGSNSVTQTTVNSGTDTENNTETRNLSHGNTRTDNLSHAELSGNTRTDNLTHNETTGNTRTDDLAKNVGRTLTRHGNIGVTTSQQMLQSEIELRQWNFYDQVFRDLDSVLTCPVY